MGRDGNRPINAVGDGGNVTRKPASDDEVTSENAHNRGNLYSRLGSTRAHQECEAQKSCLPSFSLNKRPNVKSLYNTGYPAEPRKRYARTSAMGPEEIVPG